MSEYISLKNNLSVLITLYCSNAFFNYLQFGFSKKFGFIISD